MSGSGMIPAVNNCMVERMARSSAVSRDQAPPFGFGTDVWPGIAKLAEESGEVLVEIGKLMMTGGDSRHWSGDLRQRLINELGDQRAAHMFVLAHNFTPDEIHTIGRRTAEKLALFEQWHSEGNDLPLAKQPREVA